MDDLDEIKVKPGSKESPLGILRNPPAGLWITIGIRIQGDTHQKRPIDIEDLQGGFHRIVRQIEPEDTAFERDWVWSMLNY